MFFGFGIFSANAAVRFGETGRGWSVQPTGYLDERMLNAARDDGYSRLGYLTEPEFGYAMACYAWLRNETGPGWAADLDPGPRAHLRQGLAYLSGEAEPGRFPTRKAGPVSIKIVSKGSRFPAGMYFPPRRGSFSPR